MLTIFYGCVKIWYMEDVRQLVIRKYKALPEDKPQKLCDAMGGMTAGFIMILLSFGIPVVSEAATRYVSQSGLHLSPYTNWGQAATNISTALAAAAEGDEIWVSNGTYYLSAQLQITNGIGLLGVYGAEATILDAQGSGRCLYMAHSNAWVDGLTIRNGHVEGEGGGGVLCEGGGTIRNSIIAQNSVITVSGGGGGVYLNGGGSVLNCQVVNNQVESRNFTTGDGLGGGGIACAYGGLVENSKIAYNVSHAAGTGGGGGVSCWGGGVVRGCTVHSNTNYSGEGYGGGGICAMTFGGEVLIDSCTIIRNFARGWSASDQGYGGGFWSWGRSTVVNTIIYTNRASWSGHNVYEAVEPSEYRNCCIWPAPTNSIATITNDPSLDPATFRLRADSPCIDAGTNTLWVQEGQDGEGQSRLFNGQVDIGADEAALVARSMVATDSVDIAWEVVPFAVCQLRMTTNLLDPTWQDIGTIFTNSAYELILSDTNAIESTRFYQLMWFMP